VAPRPLTGARILFPASDRAREETVRALEAAGARVTQVPAYRTLAREEAPAELHRLLGEGVDAVTFTSPSAARALGAPPRSAGLPRVAALGETTAAPLRAAGWPDIIVPERPGLDDLAEALARSFAGAEE
jgi:uroporphyrinogen III methyltransferase/synthase